MSPTPKDILTNSEGIFVHHFEPATEKSSHIQDTSPTKRTIHHEDAETVFGGVQGQVALEAIQGHQTGAELATKYEVHPTQIAAWKREAVEKLAKVFDEKGSDREKTRDGEIASLQSSPSPLT